MNSDEFSCMDLPGYWALCGEERTFGLWTGIWAVWGVIVAGLILWHDGQLITAVAFLAAGVVIARYGWRALTVLLSIIDHWAEKRLGDKELETALYREMCDSFAAADLEGGDDLERANSPTQRRWLDEKVFMASFMVAPLLGCTWGAAVGGLFGAVCAFHPDAEFSGAAGAVVGLFAGAAAVAWLASITMMLMPLPKDVSSRPWSFRERLLLLASPLFVVPALWDAAVRWTHWHFQRRTS